MDKVLVLGALLAAFGIYYLSKRNGLNIEIEESKTDILDLPFVLEWFQRSDIKQLINSNSNYYPVLINSKIIKNYIKESDISKVGISENIDNVCFQAIFDNSKGEILKLRKITFSKIDQDLKAMFRDKDMIVLT